MTKPLPVPSIGLFHLTTYDMPNDISGANQMNKLTTFHDKCEDNNFSGGCFPEAVVQTADTGRTPASDWGQEWTSTPAVGSASADLGTAELMHYRAISNISLQAGSVP